MLAQSSVFWDNDIINYSLAALLLGISLWYAMKNWGWEWDGRIMVHFQGKTALDYLYSKKSFVLLPHDAVVDRLVICCGKGNSFPRVEGVTVHFGNEAYRCKFYYSFEGLCVEFDPPLRRLSVDSSSHSETKQLAFYCSNGCGKVSLKSYIQLFWDVVRVV